MVKKKSQRLAVIKKLAEWKERDAAAVLSHHQTRLLTEQQQLQDLQHYYRDYLDTIDQQTQVASVEIINYRNFCQQLSLTIRQGEQRVHELQGILEQAKNQWLVCRNKRQVLEEMIQRCERDESRVLESNLEKELEDIINNHTARTTQ